MLRKSDKTEDAGGMAFVGSAILGLGLGVVLEQIVAGLLVGVGAGFMLMAAIRMQGTK